MAQTSRESSRQSPEQRDAALIAGIAALMAMNASPAATATKVAALIGVPVAAVLPIVKLAMSKPWASNVSAINPAGGPTATGQTAQAEGLFRGAYVLSASRRYQDGLKAGVQQEVLRRQEQRWFSQHLAAQGRRRTAAAQVDKAVGRYGAELGWYAKLDSKTSPECRAAHGKNFNAAQRPPIGYPGAVHLECRCKAGKPFATKKSVYSIKPEQRSA